MPTPEGLWDMTVELWKQPEFLAEPGVREIVQAVGLPTLEDCQRALQDSEALSMLETCQLLTLQAVMATIDAAEAVAERSVAADRALTDRLDKVSGYAHWSALHSLYEEWSR